MALIAEIIGFLSFGLVFALVLRQRRGEVLTLLLPLFLYFFLIETMAVSVGKYQYTQEAKIWIANIPLAIPFASTALVYGVFNLTEKLASIFKLKKTFFFSSTDAGLMVLADLLIDPLAVRLGFWRYRQGGLFFGVPFWNYLGWFLAIFLFSAVYRSLKRLEFKKRFWLILVWVGLIVLVRLGLYFWQGEF